MLEVAGLREAYVYILTYILLKDMEVLYANKLFLIKSMMMEKTHRDRLRDNAPNLNRALKILGSATNIFHMSMPPMRTYSTTRRYEILDNWLCQKRFSLP